MKLLSGLACALTLTLAIASWMHEAARAQSTSRAFTHVACVGDSITAGVGVSSENNTYPARLQEKLGPKAQVKNFGYSGATMLSTGFGDMPYQERSPYQAATSFVSNAGSDAVVAVIIMLGTNDSKGFNWKPEGKPKNDQQFLKDYRGMIAHFSSLTPKPKVYLALPTFAGRAACCAISGDIIHDEIVPLIKQLAQEQHLPIIDAHTPSLGHMEYLTSDQVHPNDAGYAQLAEIMTEALVSTPKPKHTASTPKLKPKQAQAL